MPTSAPGPSQTFRVGRITVDLPTSVRYADGSNGGTYDWTPIQEQPWPEGLPTEGRERDEARAADWAARVADAERQAEDERETARDRGESGDGIVVRERAIEAEGGRWTRSLSWPDYSGDQTWVVVVADAGPVRLVSEQFVITPQAESTKDETAEVLAAYVPAGAPGYGTENWLYLRYGAVARPPAEYEAVGAQFVGYPPFEEITFGMSTRLSPSDGPPLDEPSLLGRWRETKKVGLKRWLGRLAPPSLRAEEREVRVGPRPAGPFAGEEVVVTPWFEDVEDGEPVSGGWVRLQWEYLGTPDAGRDPSVTIEAATPPGPTLSDEDVAQALAAWDAALTSIRLGP